MRSSTYIVTAPDGIHARPAGCLVKEAGNYQADITISCQDKTASARKLFALMKLGVRQGDTIIVTADGLDEAAALEAVMRFIEVNF